MTTLYELLGAPRAANSTELRAAYRRKVLEVHPDKGGNIELCKRVMAAYEQLMHPERRREYDNWLACRTASQSPMLMKLPKTWREAAAAAPTSSAAPDYQGNGTHYCSRKQRPCVAEPGAAAKRAATWRGAAKDRSAKATKTTTRGGGRNSAGFPTKCSRRASGTGGIAKMNLLLARIVSLLRKLDYEQRRQFISRRLSEPQRLALEVFMKCMPESVTSLADGRPPPQRSSSSGRRGSVPAAVPAVCCGPVWSSDMRHSVGVAPRGVKRSCNDLSFQLGKEQEQTEETYGEGDRGPQRWRSQKRVAITRLHACDDSQVQAGDAGSQFTSGKPSGGQRSRRSASRPGSAFGARASPAHCNGQHDELRAARKLAPGARGGSHGSARGAARVRGIVRTSHGSFTYYHAQVGFAYFTMRTRWRQSLADAVEDYAILIVIKLRLLEAAAVPGTSCQDVSPSGAEDMELKLQDAFADAFADQGVAQAQLGLRICVSIPTRYAHYLVGRSLRSPSYTAEELPKALHTWLAFRAAGEEGQHTGGPGTAFRAPPGAQKIKDTWQRVRTAYMESWAERGLDADRLGAELDSFMERRADHREHEWEMVESASMAREERQQRAHERSKASPAGSSRCRPDRAASTAKAGRHKTGSGREDAVRASAEKQEKCCLQKLDKLAEQWATRLSAQHRCKLPASCTMEPRQ